MNPYTHKGAILKRWRVQQRATQKEISTQMIAAGHKWHQRTVSAAEWGSYVLSELEVESLSKILTSAFERDWYRYSENLPNRAEFRAPDETQANGFMQLNPAPTQKQGKLVADFRGMKNLTQKGLALEMKKLGLTNWFQTTVSRVESGTQVLIPMEVAALALILGPEFAETWIETTDVASLIEIGERIRRLTDYGTDTWENQPLLQAIGLIGSSALITKPAKVNIHAKHIEALFSARQIALLVAKRALEEWSGVIEQEIDQLNKAAHG